MDLGERKLQVLAAIVEGYIATGEPVGSRAVQEALGKVVSSATIRNDMAELSELGLLEQPHASAGRVPSLAGYRLYIDKLLSPQPLSKEDRKTIDAMFAGPADDPQRMLKTASQALAQMTQLVAMSTSPSADLARVMHCEVIPVGRGNAAIVLLTSGGVMKSRLIRTAFDLTPEMREVFARVADAEIKGRALCDVTMPFIQTVAAQLGEYSLLLTPLLIGLYETAQEASEASIAMDGQANLLILPEYMGLRAHALMEYLAGGSHLARLLLNHHGGVHVVLGGESSQPALDGSSVVMTRYNIGSREGGALGVIGPTRMNYAKIIPSLEYFAVQLGRLLSEAWGDPLEDDDKYKNDIR